MAAEHLAVVGERGCRAGTLRSVTKGGDTHRKCLACGRGFKNKQAVRRHLGWCEAYLAQPRWRCGGCEERTKVGEDYPDVPCPKCGADDWYDVTGQAQEEPERINGRFA